MAGSFLLEIRDRQGESSRSSGSFMAERRQPLGQMNNWSKEFQKGSYELHCAGWSLVHGV